MRDYIRVCVCVAACILSHHDQEVLAVVDPHVVNS